MHTGYIYQLSVPFLSRNFYKVDHEKLTFMIFFLVVTAGESHVEEAGC